MKQVALVGIGAGAAAALLFASIASGSVFALMLFYLSPLPLLIAGIGWGNIAGLIGGVIAAACVFALFNGYYFLLFAVSIALPALWLAHLALLARPAESLSPDKLEWYPTGRIVLWGAVSTAIATIILTVVAFGTDAQSFQTYLRDFFAGAEERFRAENNLGPDKLFNTELVAQVMPALGAGLSGLILLINTSLAARVVRVSGQLRRPWPDLPAMTLPRTAIAGLVFAFAGLVLPGFLAVIAMVFAGALTMAFVVLGFAVLHAMTRGVFGRPLMLGVIYTLVIIFGWPALFMALIGLADTAFDLRRTALTRAPPPLE